MLILYCNDALLGRQFHREVEAPWSTFQPRFGAGRGAIRARDAKTARLRDKEAGTAIVGAPQVELAERAHVDDELPDEGESNTGVEAR
jgi:hypothetical protein